MTRTRARATRVVLPRRTRRARDDLARATMITAGKRAKKWHPALRRRRHSGSSAYAETKNATCMYSSRPWAGAEPYSRSATGRGSDDEDE